MTQVEMYGEICPEPPGNSSGSDKNNQQHNYTALYSVEKCEVLQCSVTNFFVLCKQPQPACMYNSFFLLHTKLFRIKYTFFVLALCNNFEFFLHIQNILQCNILFFAAPKESCQQSLLLAHSRLVGPSTNIKLMHS